MSRILKALVVDDSGFTRKGLMQCLGETGLADFHFAEAEDGLEALEKFQPDDTDIVFVDLNMRRMGGIEFVRRLRSSQVHCPPIVLITAESNSERIEAAVNAADFDALLLRPVDSDRLRQGLRRLVESIPERSGFWTVPHGECAALAVQVVLGERYGLSLVPEKSATDSESRNVVFGMINILGDVQWSLSLGLEDGAATKVASKLAGYEIPIDSPEIGDAIGEITNIVAGQVKAMLVERGMSIECSLPTVIGASQIRFLVPRGLRTTSNRAYYRTEGGLLWVGVSVGVSSGLVL